jgi:bla regulator protein BlaR1
MIGQLSNHLWQSTLFAIAAALLTLAFRKNRAAVRYGLWFTASLKFFIPFALLMGLGSYVGWAPVAKPIAKRVAAPAISFAMVQITRPFPNSLPPLHATSRNSVDLALLAILGAWVCGFAAIIAMRFRGWRRVRAAVRSSAPVEIRAAVEVRSSPGFLEPGVVGVFRPILLLPESIPQRLSAPQFEAVLSHELCHIQRRDNLTSAIHMIVEAVFWFHPIVWWIGARMLEERERACDEAVLSLGNEPHDYAEGILNVCKSYLESPLSCVSGVTGSNLKKRIQAILAGDAPGRLTLRKKFALAAAGMAALALPVVVGISAAHIQAQFEPGVAAPKFEEVSIKSCEAYRASTLYSAANPSGVSNMLRSECTTLQRLIQQAYGLFANGHMNPLSSVTIAGGPAWTRSDLYEIDAKTEEPQSVATMNGPVLQAILEDRFKLRVHRESREVPVYDLAVAKDGPKLQPFQGNCIPWDYDHPSPGPDQCASSRFTNNGADLNLFTIADLCVFFAVTLDRPVIDQTGQAGRFNFHLELSAKDGLGFFRQAHGMPALSDPGAPATDPALVSAIKAAVEKLGLHLEPSNGPGEFVVIDSITEPRS